MSGGTTPAVELSCYVAEPVRTVVERTFVATMPAAEAYWGWLAGTGVAWGAMGPREQERLWSRHILNSLALEGFLRRDAVVLDVGSGAGLPGIPLALVRPDLRILLLDPMERRCEFLRLVVEDLGLGDRVDVVRGRGEEVPALGIGVPDVVCCRAVARVGGLVEMLDWNWPGGTLLALKGERARDEVAAARPSLRRLRLSASVHDVTAPDGDVTRVVKVVDA